MGDLRLKEAVAKLLEDRVHIPAFTLHNTFGVKRRVENFEPHPLAGSNPRLLAPSGPLELKS